VPRRRALPLICEDGLVHYCRSSAASRQALLEYTVEDIPRVRNRQELRAALHRGLCAPGGLYRFWRGVQDLARRRPMTAGARLVQLQ